MAKEDWGNTDFWRRPEHWDDGRFPPEREKPVTEEFLLRSVMAIAGQGDPADIDVANGTIGARRDYLLANDEFIKNLAERDKTTAALTAQRMAVETEALELGLRPEATQELLQAYQSNVMNRPLGVKGREARDETFSLIELEQRNIAEDKKEQMRLQRLDAVERSGRFSYDQVNKIALASGLPNVKHKVKTAAISAAELGQRAVEDAVEANGGKPLTDAELDKVVDGLAKNPKYAKEYEGLQSKMYKAGFHPIKTMAGVTFKGTLGALGALPAALTLGFLTKIAGGVVCGMFGHPELAGMMGPKAWLAAGAVKGASKSKAFHNDHDSAMKGLLRESVKAGAREYNQAAQEAYETVDRSRFSGIQVTDMSAVAPSAAAMELTETEKARAEELTSLIKHLQGIGFSDGSLRGMIDSRAENQGAERYTEQDYVNVLALNNKRDMSLVEAVNGIVRSFNTEKPAERSVSPEPARQQDSSPQPSAAEVAPQESYRDVADRVLTLLENAVNNRLPQEQMNQIINISQQVMDNAVARPTPGTVPDVRQEIRQQQQQDGVVPAGMSRT